MGFRDNKRAFCRKKTALFVWKVVGVGLFCLIAVILLTFRKEAPLTDKEDPAPADPVAFAVASPSEDKHIIAGIEYIDQKENYPSACESVCAVMACRFASIPMEVDTFIQSYLPQAQFLFKNGESIGYHPNERFMGDPYSDSSFGCYAPCIETAIRRFLPRDYTVKNTTGTDLSTLCHRYIDRDIPVMIWATQEMMAPEEGVLWTLHGGGTFQWIKGEHCLLLTGFDETCYYFHDPLAGVVSYERSLVEERYAALGAQSLVLYRVPLKTRRLDAI